MSRHREHDPDGEAPDVVAIDPLASYRPLKQRGPATTLSEPLGLEVCQRIAAGRTLRDAAARAGTNETCVQGWLRRGREAIEQGEQNLFTWFVVEYEAASAHFRETLDKTVLANIGNRALNEKYIRWRLSISDPKGHTLPREPPTPAANGLGPLFELVTPDQARVRLEEKLNRFLGEQSEEPPPPAEPPPQASPEDAEEEDEDGT